MSWLHYLLPSWAQWVLGLASLSTIVIVGVILWFGGGKVIAAFFEPISAWLGKAIVIFLGWLADGIGIAYRNPEVFAPCFALFLYLGCRYYLPLRIELAAAKSEITQCVPKRGKHRAPYSLPTISSIEEQASSAISKFKGMLTDKPGTKSALAPPAERGWSLN